MRNLAKSKTVALDYQFILRKGDPLDFNLKLRLPALQLEAKPPADPPSWTHLEWHQCPHCPLRVRTHPHCPIALNLVDPVSRFARHVSFEEVQVVLKTPARSYTQTLTLQHGLSSLMGVIMVTSGCPIMDKLRPMVMTHLPFATAEETIYRAASMYLLAQYFIQKRGGSPDWPMKKLVKLYEDVSTVNRSFTKRLVSSNTRDASLNALFDLDCFANLAVISVTDSGLAEFEPLFQAYLDSLDT